MDLCKSCKNAVWGSRAKDMHGDMEIVEDGEKRMVCTQKNLNLTFSDDGWVCNKYEMEEV